MSKTFTEKLQLKLKQRPIFFHWNKIVNLLRERIYNADNLVMKSLTQAIYRWGGFTTIFMAREN